MSSRRVTLILNSNQTKRATVVLPPPSADDDQYNVRDHILALARNKFHDKNLNTVYQWGGEALGTDAALPPNAQEVLLSKGEAYIGPPPKHGRSDGKVGAVSVIAEKSFVHQDAVKQLKTVAALEGVHAAIGMPDLHRGDRFPIGCAVVAAGVYPALIGSDVGCGIALYPLGKLPSHLTPDKLAARLYGRDLDGPWEGSPRDWLARHGVTQHSDFDEMLGTVGAGNHFAEICTVERVVDADACAAIGIRAPELYLLVHTGSRGLGASILRNATANDSNPYYAPDSPELEAYLAQHDHAVAWARANRDLVAHRIKQCLFDKRPSEPGIGTSTEEEDGAQDEEDEEADLIAALGKLLDVTHNSAVRKAWTVDGAPQQAWIHRKGAAPSDTGPVPCPGSRGDFSWILQPSGDGEVNAHSLAHGAGRMHPRNAHILRARTQNADLTHTKLGSHVVCTDPALLVEERPEAYKSVQAVIDDMEARGIARGVAVLRPFVTYKCGDAAGGGVSAREREREKAMRTTGLGSGGSDPTRGAAEGENEIEEELGDGGDELQISSPRRSIDNAS